MSFLQHRPVRVSLTALAVVGLGLGIPLLQAAADPSAAAVCLEAGNVWVLVETDDTIDGGCATEFGTGFEALASAGFDAAVSEAGFLNTIDGMPDVKGPEDWWAYAHTGEDLSAWEFYMVGGAESKPVAGSIDAWRLIHSWEAEDTFPTVTPDEVLQDVESSPNGTASATQSPSMTATASASASGSPSASASATSMATATPSQRPLPSLPNTGN